MSVEMTTIDDVRVLLRDERQRRVTEWARSAFGDAEATSLGQRGVRLLEEAIEAFQACGGDEEIAHKLVAFVFARPAGILGQELGGVSVTVLALAAAAGLSADEEECREISRVLSKPVEEFTARNARKNEAGFKMPLPSAKVDVSLLKAAEQIIKRDRELSSAVMTAGHEYILGTNGLVVGCTCGLSCDTVGFSAHQAEIAGAKILSGPVSVLKRFEIIAKAEHFDVLDQREPNVYRLHHRHCLAFHSGSLLECLTFLNGWVQHRQVAEERS